MTINQLNRKIYWLNVEDVQTVAQDVLERDLTDTEVRSMEEIIAKNIGWYDAIHFAIMNKFGSETDDSDILF